MAQDLCYICARSTYLSLFVEVHFPDRLHISSNALGQVINHALHDEDTRNGSFSGKRKLLTRKQYFMTCTYQVSGSTCWLECLSCNSFPLSANLGHSKLYAMKLVFKANQRVGCCKIPLSTCPMATVRLLSLGDQPQSVYRATSMPLIIPSFVAPTCWENKRKYTKLI